MTRAVLALLASALLVAGLFETVRAREGDNVEASAGPLSLIAGDWQIVDGSGEVVQACAEAQSFEVTPDGRNVILTELGNDEWSSKYIVLHVEGTRLLMFIEGEDRTTEAGDPILWWAYFDGPDAFRWRRYDWGPKQATTAVWKRCPAG